MKSDYYLDQIKSLKKEYAVENVSLLVGSGFSKNALVDFPDWNQLLTDMIIELYKNKFSHLTDCNPDNDDVKKIIQEIVDDIGYLELVSQFVKKKTIREAVEVYIEERTPYINDETHEFIIPNKKDSIKINDTDLSLHKKIFEGKWEQVYTTNYDNLLEYTAKISKMGWQVATSGHHLSFSDTKKIL